MIETVLGQGSGTSWVDATNPTKEELEELVRRYTLHANSVQDCLEPAHLPKYEKIGAWIFLILRAYDEEAPADADTAQSMTRKVALFVDEKRLLTIHRKGQRYLSELKAEAAPSDTTEILVLRLVDAVLQTYRKPLADAEKAVTDFEEVLFEQTEVTYMLRHIHLLKRRVNVIRWMVRRTQELSHEVKPSSERTAPAHRDVLDRAAGLYFAADELLTDINNLLNMQLSLASHRTSEVMRVLTIFSVFFMPLTFIVGVYGMNFEHMPELKWRFGYLFAWLIMASACLLIYRWFRRKGWMK